jgi:hypothetical protein
MKRVYALSALLLMLFPAFTTSAQASESSNVYAMREGYVDANGVMIYYKIFGRGKPLVIVHGGPQGAWRDAWGAADFHAWPIAIEVP